MPKESDFIPVLVYNSSFNLAYTRGCFRQKARCEMQAMTGSDSQSFTVYRSVSQAFSPRVPANLFTDCHRVVMLVQNMHSCAPRTTSRCSTRVLHTRVSVRSVVAPQHQTPPTTLANTPRKLVTIDYAQLTDGKTDLCAQIEEASLKTLLRITWLCMGHTMMPVRCMCTHVLGARGPPRIWLVACPVARFCCYHHVLRLHVSLQHMTSLDPK